MVNAWVLTNNHLEMLIKNVDAGKVSIGLLRDFMLKMAQSEVINLRGDIATIQGQLLGVKVVKVDNLVQALQSGALGQAA